MNTQMAHMTDEQIQVQDHTSTRRLTAVSQMMGLGLSEEERMMIASTAAYTVAWKEKDVDGVHNSLTV